jgi:hypothetical protein
VRLQAAIFVILLVSKPASSQTSWEDYYPLHIGDFWEYQEYDNNIPVTFSRQVVKDTLMSNGKTYKVIKSTTIGGPYPGVSFSYQRLTLDGLVLGYTPFGCDDTLYLLSARIGDSVRTNCWQVSSLFWMLSQMDRAIVFGDTLTVMTWALAGGQFPVTEYLAERIGLLRYSAEGSDGFLRGAIIAGKKYGDITVSVQEELKSPPKGYSLAQNYPNPFNPRTTIEYSLHTKQHVALKVFDCLGREVVCLVDEVQDPGRHYVQWNGKDWRGRAVSSGVYFYRIQGASLQDTRKLIYLR